MEVGDPFADALIHHLEAKHSSLCAEAAYLAEDTDANGSALALAAARSESERAAAAAAVAKAALLRFENAASGPGAVLGREEVGRLLALRGLPCSYEDVTTVMGLMGTNAEHEVTKEAYLPLHSALIRAARSASAAACGGPEAPAFGSARSWLWEAKMAEIFAGERRHVAVALSERRAGWEPARDEALRLARARAQLHSVPSSPRPPPSALPSLPLGPELASVLLRGRVSDQKVLEIKRLTRSSIWLFSSSTFRASRMGWTFPASAPFLSTSRGLRFFLVAAIGL